MTENDVVYALAMWLGVDPHVVQVTAVPEVGHIYVVVDALVTNHDVHAVLRHWAPVGFLWIVVTNYYRPLASGKCGCCGRGDEYNGFGSDAPFLFVCPKHCACHD